MSEDKRVADGDLFANLLIHGVDVSLIDTHTFLGQGRGVVNRNVM